jgi:hypothetical protein
VSANYLVNNWRKPAARQTHIDIFVGRENEDARCRLKRKKSLSLALVHFRVTGLAEFSPNGRVFTLGIFLKITEVALIFVQLFPNHRLCITFDKKWVGLNFGQYFSQTHPVTPVP